jgi:hypothetical protein
MNEPGDDKHHYDDLKNRINRINLDPTLIALDAIDPPADRLPEPEYIYVTKEDLEKMFPKRPMDKVHLTLEDIDEIFTPFTITDSMHL